MRAEAACVYYVAATLDGFIAGPNHEIDWLVNDYPAEEAGYDDFFARVTGIVMGRTTYDVIRRHPEWPYGKRPTLVATRRQLGDAPEGVFAFAGEPAAMLAALRARGAGGRIWLEGGGNLAGQFLAAGLIDEIELGIIPVLLGKGIPLFGGVDCPRLDLQWAKPLGSGIIHALYRLPGAGVRGIRSTL